MDNEMICRKAHEEYHMLLEKMMMSFEDPTITITKDEAEHYNLLRNLCEDMIMDKQRKYLWNPLNRAVNEADGIHTVLLSHEMPMMKELHGKDMTKAVKHMLKHFESMKTSNPQAYQNFMLELDK